MKTRRFGLVILVAALSAMAFAGAGMARAAVPAPRPPEAAAQAETNLPPAIISFTSDLDKITLADAEAGQTSARLSWQTVGLAAGHRLLLQTLKLNAWVSLLTEDAAPLPASGSYDIVVEHPLNFGPPTYSLTIVDAQGNAYDQRLLIIPYDLEAVTDPPRIESVAAEVQNLDATAIATGTARVGVSWKVVNRAPTANLRFEQVLEGGSTVPVELPRPNLWIPSAGSGVVAPVLPEPGQQVRLQVRVVDMEDGSTLAEQMLPPISVTGTVSTPVAVVSTPVPAAPTASGARILSFVATPETVERGGTVTVSWQVTGATSVGVWLLSPDGRLSISVPNPPLIGSWTVPLGDWYTDAAAFMLFADDTAGNRVQASATVHIICPYTYFFGTVEGGSTCPLGPAATVQAAFQRFEHGFMMWRADTGQILALYEPYAMGTVEFFKDGWQGETITYPETPPPGLYQPVRGFGKVWVDNPHIREAFGWAVSQEQGYTMQYQQSSDFKYARLYMSWPDGTVIYTIENEWGYK
jgi:hypothetical protein